MANISGLHGFEFKDYFNKLTPLRHCYLGVRSIDEIPYHLGNKRFLICNLSPAGHPGSHWVVIFRSHKENVEIFNSLGFENLDLIKPHLNFSFKTQLVYNDVAVQVATSSTCGFFCIYFAVHRVLNLDQTFDETFEEIFSFNKHENETTVMNFCNHLKEIDNESQLFDF